MATTEDIEARLAAYIDGELDAAGRVEIERHLASNPQHRVLIEQLTQQRDMLRALPRARAPVDVAENINAHLERAALLGDDDAAAVDQPILRIGHWSQLKAMAAVLLLVFSLAAVVYYVVSSPKTNDEFARSIATAPTAPSASESASAAGPTTGTSDGAADVAPPSVLVGRGNPDTERRPSSIQEMRAREALTDSIGAVRRPTPDTADPALPPHLADTRARDAANGGAAVAQNGAIAGSARQVVVEIVSSDPFAAQQDVERYLVSNNIEYQPAEDAPEPLRLQASNIAHASRMQQTRVQMKSAPEELPQAQQPKQENERMYLAGKLSRSQVDDLRLNMDTKLGQRAQVIEATAADTSTVREDAVGGADPDVFAPTTLPAFVQDEIDGRAEAKDVQPTTQPEAQLQLSNVFAADAPAAAATQPVEGEQWDVVIVVRSPDGADAGAGIAEPLASQPAQTPATQPQGALEGDPPATSPATAPAESDD